MNLNKLINIKFYFILFILINKLLVAEVIYLKDGQIINGPIISENKKSITVKTKYQKRNIPRDHILRILYGDRKLEPVNILLKDGNLLKGFLVDQDSGSVIFRRKKDSNLEETIPKSNIKQMSGEEINLFYPDVFINIGLFSPIDTGGSKLDYAPIYSIGAGFNFLWIENTRIIFEAGFVKSESWLNSGQYFQIIPVTLSAAYSVPVFFISIVPKIGFGVAIIDFNDGESEKLRGYNYEILAGLGFVYELKKNSIYLNLWGEYNLYIEEDEMLNSFIVKTGLSYRF